MMNFILDAQNQLLASENLALLPLLALLYSFLSSPHCSVMCSPFIPGSGSSPKLYLGRLASYSLMGMLLGSLGQALMKSLEVKLVAALAFFLFALLTLSMLGLPLIPKLKTQKLKTQDAFFRGFLMAFIPCHLLYFFYSLAVFSGSPLGGGLILFGHAVCTMPALAYGQRFWTKIIQNFPLGKKAVLFVIYLVCLVNLSYFGSRLFYSDQDAKAKLLFCF